MDRCCRILFYNNNTRIRDNKTQHEVIVQSSLYRVCKPQQRQQRHQQRQRQIQFRCYKRTQQLYNFDRFNWIRMLLCIIIMINYVDLLNQSKIFSTTTTIMMVHAGWVDPDTPEQYSTTKPFSTHDDPREFQLVCIEF
jgi:hypothetical protein